MKKDISLKFLFSGMGILFGVCLIYTLAIDPLAKYDAASETALVMVAGGMFLGMIIGGVMRLIRRPINFNKIVLVTATISVLLITLKDLLGID